MNFILRAQKTQLKLAKKVTEEVESVRFCITDSNGSLLSKKEAEIFLKGLLGDEYLPELVHN